MYMDHWCFVKLWRSLLSPTAFNLSIYSFVLLPVSLFPLLNSAMLMDVLLCSLTVGVCSGGKVMSTHTLYIRTFSFERLWAFILKVRGMTHVTWSKFDWCVLSGRWRWEVSANRQTNVQSFQMADPHSFDLMWPGQSLTDLWTGSFVGIRHVCRQTERNIPSFLWRKWSNSHLFKCLLLPHCFICNHTSLHLLDSPLCQHGRI